MCSPVTSETLNKSLPFSFTNCTKFIWADSFASIFQVWNLPLPGGTGDAEGRGAFSLCPAQCGWHLHESPESSPTRNPRLFSPACSSPPQAPQLKVGRHAEQGKVQSQQKSQEGRERNQSIISSHTGTDMPHYFHSNKGFWEFIINQESASYDHN